MSTLTKRRCWSSSGSPIVCFPFGITTPSVRSATVQPWALWFTTRLRFCLSTKERIYYINKSQWVHYTSNNRKQRTLYQKSLEELAENEGLDVVVSAPNNPPVRVALDADVAAALEPVTGVFVEDPKRLLVWLWAAVDSFCWMKKNQWKQCQKESSQG